MVCRSVCLSVTEHQSDSVSPLLWDYIHLVALPGVCRNHCTGWEKRVSIPIAVAQGLLDCTGLCTAWPSDFLGLSL